MGTWQVSIPFYSTCAWILIHALFWLPPSKIPESFWFESGSFGSGAPRSGIPGHSPKGNGRHPSSERQEGAGLMTWVDRSSKQEKGHAAAGSSFWLLLLPSFVQRKKITHPLSSDDWFQQSATAAHLVWIMALQGVSCTEKNNQAHPDRLESAHLGIHFWVCCLNLSWYPSQWHAWLIYTS